jgi:glycosyltransferase involved in cell wall biosynthesis
MFLFTNPEAKDKYETSGFFGHNPNRAMVVGLALNTDVFRSIKVKKYSIPTIISVGGLYKVKGHQLVIQAFKKLVDRGLKNVRLHVYGRGDYKGKLVKLVHSLKLDDYVEFKGHVSHEELAEAYNKAHLLVVANLKEFTTPIGEAMLCNLPVVAMGCGGIRYAIPDDSYGFVAKRLNLEDLADKMERLIKDDRLREKISRKGRDYTLKTFGYQAVAERSYDAYSKLIT